MTKKIIIGVVLITIVLSTVACTYELRGSDGYIMWTNEVRHQSLDGLHPIEENGLWGFICIATREKIIEPQFSWARSFSEGLAFVRGVEGREYQTGYIDLEGNLVIPLPMIYQGFFFSEGLAFVIGVDERDDLNGYIDLTGDLVIPLSGIQSGDSFSEGLAFVRGIDGREDLTGYIDIMGNLVIPLPTVIAARPFSHGFALIIEREWNDNEPELAIGVPGPYIFIDGTGQNAFGREFGSAGIFIDGLAVVSLRNGNMMYMNTSGRNAFRREFQSASAFIGDYANVTLLNGSPARINRSGRVVSRAW